MAPDPIRQPPSVEIGVDGHVVAEPLGRSEQNVEFDLLYTDRLLNTRGREETMLLGSSTLEPMVRALIACSRFRCVACWRNVPIPPFCERPS